MFSSASWRCGTLACVHIILMVIFLTFTVKVQKSALTDIQLLCYFKLWQRTKFSLNNNFNLGPQSSSQMASEEKFFFFVRKSYRFGKCGWVNDFLGELFLLRSADAPHPIKVSLCFSLFCPFLLSLLEMTVHSVIGRHSISALLEIHQPIWHCKSIITLMDSPMPDSVTQSYFYLPPLSTFLPVEQGQSSNETST